MAVSHRLVTLVAVAALLAAGPALAVGSGKRDIRGAMLGMRLSEATEVLTRNGAVCGKGVFDTHRCDFDSDTWIHLHVVGPDKTVEAIRYYYPAFNDPDRAAVFQAKVIDLYHLSPIDKVSKFISDTNATVTIRDGELDLESVMSPDPVVEEPKL